MTPNPTMRPCPRSDSRATQTHPKPEQKAPRHRTGCNPLKRPSSARRPRERPATPSRTMRLSRRSGSCAKPFRRRHARRAPQHRTGCSQPRCPRQASLPKAHRAVPSPTMRLSRRSGSCAKPFRRRHARRAPQHRTGCSQPRCPRQASLPKAHRAVPSPTMRLSRRSGSCAKPFRRRHARRAPQHRTGCSQPRCPRQASLPKAHRAGPIRTSPQCSRLTSHATRTRPRPVRKARRSSRRRR